MPSSHENFARQFIQRPVRGSAITQSKPLRARRYGPLSPFFNKFADSLDLGSMVIADHDFTVYHVGQCLRRVSVPFGSEGYEEALERAARAVHENENGKGSWTDAPTVIRSNRRHQVRLVVSTLEKNGYCVQPLDEANTIPVAPQNVREVRSRRALAKPN